MAARAGGDVWASTPVFVGGSGGTRWPIRRFSATGTILQTIPDPSMGYERDIRDLALSPNGKILYAPAVRVDKLSVTSLGVLRYDTATGDALPAIAVPAPGAEYPQTATVAPDGDVYVTTLTGAIKRYGADGTFEANLVLSHSRGGLGVGKPAVDPRNGDLLILDGASSTPQEIDRYSAAGVYLGTVDRPGSEFGRSVAVRPQNGTIHVGSGYYAYVFTAAGKFARLAQAPSSGSLWDISIGPDGTRLWALDNRGSVAALHFFRSARTPARSTPRACPRPRSTPGRPT